MSTESGTAGGVVLLNDGRRLFVRRPEEGDLAALDALDGVPFLYFVCGQKSAHPPSICECIEPCGQHSPVVVAALENGPPVAAAWIHADGDDPCLGRFLVAIQPGFNRPGVTPLLLHELAEAAGKKGISRMRSCVDRGIRDPLTDCRGAGLPVLSAMSFGGVTEVMLDATGVREVTPV